MMPVSRRTIASAICVWRSGGSEWMSRSPSSCEARAEPDHLGEQRDDERQHAVEDVQLVGVVAAEDEQQAEQRLEDHRRLGDPQRVPEAGRRLALEPGVPAPDPGDEVGGDQADPDDEMDFRHGRESLEPVFAAQSRQKGSEFGLLMRKSTM